LNDENSGLNDENGEIRAIKTGMKSEANKSIATDLGLTPMGIAINRGTRPVVWYGSWHRHIIPSPRGDA
jgi:hypothetical protein